MENDEALTRFVQVKGEIDRLLEALTEASEDHFGQAPDGINFSHVENLHFVKAQLSCAARFLNLKVEN